MFELAAFLLVAVFAAIPPALAGWWLLSVHRELVLLSYAVHRARELGDAAAVARAEAALRLRLASFPGGHVGRWMGVDSPAPTGRG
jgi:hypothetical protein